MENTSDPVNHPPHYQSGGLEVIDILKSKLTEEEYKGYLLGNCFKYQFRARFKGKELEDLKKSRWYLDRLISELE